MAGASLFLPFLPLLPKQILLTNLLTDLPEMTIATDSVDPEMVERPRRWDIGFIRRFMVVFGVVSSVFDFSPSACCSWSSTPAGGIPDGMVRGVGGLGLDHCAGDPHPEAVLRQSARPVLLASTVVVALATLVLPYASPGRALGFQRWPVGFLSAMGAIVASYVAATELAKRAFYGRRRSHAP